MITISTENLNHFSQDFYNNIISSLDFSLIQCTCGHTGCLIRHGSYKRKMQLNDQILTLVISRVFCNSCGHTHALLLSSMVPYSQIPLYVQYEAVQAFEKQIPLSSLLDSQCLIDEGNLHSVIRNYKHYWHQRILSFSLRLTSLELLIRDCFSFFSRQFLQIKTTRNILFSKPT